MERERLDKMSIELEKQFVSILLHFPEKVEKYIESVSPSSFSLEKSRWIVGKAKSHYEQYGSLPSKDIVKSYLSELGEGEKETYVFLKSCWKEKPEENNLEYLVDYFKKSHIYQGLLSLMADVSKDVSVDKVYDSLEKVEDFVLSKSKFFDTQVKLTNMAFDFPQRLKEKISTSKFVVPTPIRELNKALGGGFRSSQFIVFAAPSGEGKSIMLLNCAQYAYLKGFNVLLVTIEMSTLELMDRLYSLITGLDHRKFYEFNLDPVEKSICLKKLLTWIFDKNCLEELYKFVSEKNITLDNISTFHSEICKNFKKKEQNFHIADFMSGCTLDRLQLEIKKLMKQNPIQLVVIDFLNLVRPKKYSGQTWQDIKDVAESMKQIGRYFEIPIVSACQLKTGDILEKPTLEDVKYARAIGESSDWMIAFKRTDEDKLRNIIRLVITKHRHSEELIIPVKESFAQMMISDLSEVEF